MVTVTPLATEPTGRFPFPDACVHLLGVTHRRLYMILGVGWGDRMWVSLYGGVLYIDVWGACGYEGPCDHRRPRVCTCVCT